MKHDKMKEVIFLKSSQAKILAILKGAKNIDFFGLVDSQKNTPLHYAASLGYVEVLSKYLQLLQEQQLWYKRFGDNITRAWIKSNVKYWLNSQNNDGLTAIHFASLNGHIEIIRLLDEAGANLDKTTNTGLNVFTIAAKQGKISSMIYFQNKVDSNMSDLKQCSAIHWAVFKGYDSIVRYLVKNNYVQIDFRQVTGKTPLHIAVIQGYTKIVKILLLAGANRFVKDKESKLPQNYAEELKQQKILRILTQQERSGCYRKTFVFRKRQKDTFYMTVLVFMCTIAIVAANYLANLSSLLSSFATLEKSQTYNLPIIQFIAQIIGTITFFIGSIYLYFETTLQSSGDSQREMLLMRNFIRQPETFSNYCPSCKIIREVDIIHCQICQKCIKNKVFHNHIIGCCISMDNVKLYIGFTLIFVMVLGSELGTGIITLIHLLSYDNMKQLSRLFVGVKVLLILIDLLTIVPIIGVLSHVIGMRRRIKSKKDGLIRRQVEDSIFEKSQALIEKKGRENEMGF